MCLCVKAKSDSSVVSLADIDKLVAKRVGDDVGVQSLALASAGKWIRDLESEFSVRSVALATLEGDGWGAETKISVTDDVSTGLVVVALVALVVLIVIVCIVVVLVVISVVIAGRGTRISVVILVVVGVVILVVVGILIRVLVGILVSVLVATGSSTGAVLSLNDISESSLDKEIENT